MENDNKSRVQLMNDLFNEPEQPRPSRQSSQISTSRQTSSSRVNNVQPVRESRESASGSRPRVSSSSNASRRTDSADNYSRSRTVNVSADEVNVSRRSVSSTSASSQVRRSSSMAPSANSSSSNRRPSGNTRTTSPNRTYSDIVEERRVKGSSSGKSKSKGKKKSKKKNNGFKKFLVIYAAILLVIIIIGTIILNSFLVAYEAAQPVNAIRTVITELSDSDNLDSYLDKNESLINVPAGVLDYKSAVIEKLKGKNIEFIQNEKYTPSAPSYNIKADGVTVAEVNLKPGETGSFGLNSWEISNIDVTKCFGDTKTYSVLVPEGSKVYLNGVELDSSYVVGTDVPSDLKNSVQYMANPPVFTIYQVSTVTDDIDISGTDASGAPLVFSSNENSYVAGGKATDEFIASVSGRVEEALKEYAYYFIYMAFNLSDYILDGSELSKYIFGSEEYDPINPWLYMWEDIDTYEFSLFEVSNYIKYSDDCFTCDVKYHLDMTFTDPSYKDDNQELNATWVWVKNNGEWYLTDSIVH